MTEPAVSTEVAVPLLSPNEPEAVVVTVEVKQGQAVSAGDVIAVVENTKSTEEVLAPVGGFVAGLRVAEGDRVTAGDAICWVADDPTWSPPAAASAEAGPAVPADLRISRPAVELARELGVDLDQLPRGPLVTAEMVRAAAGAAAVAPAAPTARSDLDPAAVVVYGAGGHARTLIDLVGRLAEYRIVGVVDDFVAAGTNVAGVQVLGGAAVLSELLADGVGQAINGVSGLSRVQHRVDVFTRLATSGFTSPPVVHPTAYVEPSARLAPGVQVLAGAYVGSDARIGFGTIVNTNAVVSHDCVLGECANVSPGALLAGAVRVGDESVIGMGVSVNIGVTLGARVQIGNGALVHSDVPAGGVVRSGTTWPR